MSTPLPFPYIIAGEDDCLKVSQEIALLTSALKQCRAGQIKSASSNSELRFFQHISTLVTTGRFKDRNEVTVNAVSGHVFADRIVSVVVTRNAIPKTIDKDGTCTKITPSVTRGKTLLEEWHKMKPFKTFAEHLQNVVDALSYISTTANDVKSYSLMTLFAHRYAFPKLYARVKSAIGFWGDGLFHLVARYYRERTIPGVMTSQSFVLKVTDDNHADLKRLGFVRDHTMQYQVTSENIGKWVSYIDAKYGDIERMVLQGGPPSYTALLPFKEIAALVGAIGVFSSLIRTKTLMKAIFAPGELDDRLQSAFRTAAIVRTGSETTSVPRNVTDESSSPSLDDAEAILDDGQDTWVEEEDGALDGREPNEREGGSAHLLRYCLTITAWYDSANALVRNTMKYSSLPFDVYHVDAYPLKRSLEEEELISFRTRCSSYFIAKETTNYKYGSALIFLNDKLGGEKLHLVVRDAALAVVHAEATIMGLVCISVLGGESFGNLSVEEVKKLFPESRNIPIAVSKKCCLCCTMLAEILKDHHGIDFVLPGAHATFYPWTAPPGVPLEALKKMRDNICAIFEELACAYTWVAPSTKSSPASSEISVIEPLDLSLVSYIDTKPDGNTENES